MDDTQHVGSPSEDLRAPL